MAGAYVALRFKNFRFYIAGTLIAVIGQQMQSVAVGWELYERTGSAMALGWVGLVQALPVILLALPAGHLADWVSRKRIVMSAQVVLAASSLGLAYLSYTQGSVNLIYLLLFLSGVARAFNAPARSALFPQIVPTYAFANAVTWNSSFFEIGSMAGPALGGLVIAILHSATVVYILDAVLSLIRFALVGMIEVNEIRRSCESFSLESLAVGIRFVYRTKIILATITLDLFAVLLGGAATLLPIFAKDILQAGPTALGWLRAAPSIGAFTMAMLQTHLPPMRHAGKTLLWAVAGFGLATIAFGLSSSFPLSFAMLFLTGALDNISVVIRQTLVQTLTPDELRGRVSAVNNVFISSSNELGGFESGLVAKLFGPVFSVVSGGIGTIAVVIWVNLVWPEVRRLRSLNEFTR